MVFGARVNDSSDGGTRALEDLSVFNLIWETNQKELIAAFIAGVDNLLQDRNDVFGLRPDVLASVQQVLD